MTDSSQLTQGRCKVRRSCQSTVVGGVCTELRHSDRNLRTAWFKKGDFKIGIKKTLGGFLSCVHTLPTHIYVQTTCKVNYASDDPFRNGKIHILYHGTVLVYTPYYRMIQHINKEYHFLEVPWSTELIIIINYYYYYYYFNFIHLFMYNYCIALFDHDQKLL